MWIVGVGALGSTLAESLLRAGVGNLVLVDRDVVELSNLQRQRLFTSADAQRSRPKAVAAARRLRAVDPEVAVHAFPTEFDVGFWDRERTSLPPDLVLDGTDNFATRFVINDLCGRDGVPWVYGGATGADGSGMVVLPGSERPCLRCLIPEPPPNHALATCETHGVLGPTVDAVAAWQAAQALRILVGDQGATARGMMQLDAWSGVSRLAFTHAKRRPDCASCGTGEWPAIQRSGPRLVSLCGRDAVQIRPGTHCAVDLELLAGQVARTGNPVGRHHNWLRFEADGCRFTVFADGRTLIQGVDDGDRARALFDRYVGVMPVHHGD